MFFIESPNPKQIQKKPEPEGCFYLDDSSSSSPPPLGMALPNLGPFPPPSAAAAAANTTTATSLAAEDPSKKIRKPYTITKSRESWTDPEHDKFLEALHLFDRDWKKIEAFIGSKTVIQIRSHAQKYFLKVQKSGTNEHLPPPRPKRKASHPYPQKASKAAPVLSQVAAPFQASAVLHEPDFARRPDSSTVRHAVTGPSVPSGTEKPVETASLLHVRKGKMRSGGQPVVSNFYGAGNEIIQKTQSAGEMNDQGTTASSLRVLPDFAQVYGFIGSVFDPNMTGHLQKLKKMDRIDVETVLLLMRNLSINLTSPDFENHRRLLSSYEIDLDKDHANGADSAIHDIQSEKIAQFQ